MLRKNKYNALILFLFVGTIIGFLGCGGDNGKIIDEGIIEYDATAVDPNNPMADLAPSKMLVKFKNHRSLAEMSAGMGLLTMSFVSDYDQKTITQLVKLLNKKYVSVANESQIDKELITNSPKLKFQKTNETKIIAGYKCKKIIASYENNEQPPFDVYYTDDIELEHSNWGNEFKEIDGVLMEYQLKRYNLELRFTAKRIQKAVIEDSEFETPSDYKQISQKELDDLFAGMQ